MFLNIKFTVEAFNKYTTRSFLLIHIHAHCDKNNFPKTLKISVDCFLSRILNGKKWKIRRYKDRVGLIGIPHIYVNFLLLCQRPETKCFILVLSLIKFMGGFYSKKVTADTSVTVSDIKCFPQQKIYMHLTLL